jgi:Skp family chaperone for outer membrane proteins
MKIYSVDFEQVVKNYKNYVSQMLDLDQVKMSHQTEMDVFKKEMESIIASANSGLIMDESTQKAKMQRFKELQMDASKKENEFRTKFTETQNNIMESTFEEVSVLINDYAKKSSIDMIVSKSQLVFVKDELDITDMIIDVLKTKGLFYENTLQTEKES